MVSSIDIIEEGFIKETIEERFTVAYQFEKGVIKASIKEIDMKGVIKASIEERFTVATITAVIMNFDEAI